MIDSLSQSLQSKGNNSTFSYEIETNYGSDIDPIFFRNLIVTISKDSIVTDVRIFEWNKSKSK